MQSLRDHINRPDKQLAEIDKIASSDCDHNKELPDKNELEHHL